MSDRPHAPMDLPEPRPAPRGQGWVLALGAALAAVGLFRGPAHSQDGGQGGTDGSQPTPAPVPNVSITQTGGGATSDSNGRMIAVTGIDLTGAAVLYVIDTVDPHIAVYQATGGSPSMQGIKLVAARRIDLDLALDGFNDRSQHSYKDLEEDFAASGLLPGNR